MDSPDPVALDRTSFVVASIDDESDERSFWLSRSPAERLAALELMRQIIYGYYPPGPRLQRVLAVVDGPSS